VGSLWEISIKLARGRPDFDVDAGQVRDALEQNGFFELPIAAQHAVALSNLPPLHADPFDRMLVAQAIVAPMALSRRMSGSRLIRARSRWCS
jgi:PIN domain nuclease of toxin-antitoxin system